MGKNGEGPEDDEDQDGDEDAKVGGDSGDDSGSGDDAEGLAARVDRLEDGQRKITEGLDRVLEMVTPAKGSAVGGGGAKDVAGGTAGGTVKAQEDDMEARVAKALGKITAEEQRDERLKKVEEKVFHEDPPVKQRLLTRVMGW